MKLSMSKTTGQSKWESESENVGKTEVTEARKQEEKYICSNSVKRSKVKIGDKYQDCSKVKKQVWGQWVKKSWVRNKEVKKSEGKKSRAKKSEGQVVKNINKLLGRTGSPKIEESVGEKSPSKEKIKMPGHIERKKWSQMTRVQLKSKSKPRACVSDPIPRVSVFISQKIRHQLCEEKIRRHGARRQTVNRKVLRGLWFIPGSTCGRALVWLNTPRSSTHNGSMSDQSRRLKEEQAAQAASGPAQGSDSAVLPPGEGTDKPDTPVREWAFAPVGVLTSRDEHQNRNSEQNAKKKKLKRERALEEIRIREGDLEPCVKVKILENVDGKKKKIPGRRRAADNMAPTMARKREELTGAAVDPSELPTNTEGEAAEQLDNEGDNENIGDTNNETLDDEQYVNKGEKEKPNKMKED